jgi:3',5'-cyclic AMP phosphodiesterase CpdA
MFVEESCGDLKRMNTDLEDSNLFGIGCGDLVFDNFDLFEKYNEGIKSTGIPFFQVLGNHDINLNARSNETSQEPFISQFGPPYYSFNRGETHYVVLSDVFFLGNKQYYGYLDETQLSWLKEDLAHIPKEHPLVIFLHIPSFSHVVEYNPGRDINKESVVNRAALNQILEGYEAHLISGHVHWNENRVIENIFEHNTGAISGAWWSGDICYDGTPKGYGLYQSDKGNISWKYKSIGKDLDFQFRTYPKGAHPEFTDSYCINIWNWDPEWKVFWYENGIKAGEPIREIATDPMAWEIYGPNKPKKQSWISPQKNGHMFFFKPIDPEAKIKIEVIDRFGNIYSDTIV